MGAADVVLSVVAVLNRLTLSPLCADGEPVWPVWDATNRLNLRIQTGSPVTINSTVVCNFWDSIGYGH